MKIEHEKGDNNCMVKVEKGHTHTHVVWNDEIKGEQFKEIRIQYSDFPSTAQHVHLDTFDDGQLYINVPKGVKLILDLTNNSCG